MQQEIYNECKSDLSWPYTTAPSSTPRSLVTPSDRWHPREHHSTPEAYVAESTSYLFQDARVECTTSTDEEEEELTHCVGRRQDAVSLACQPNSFDSSLIHRPPTQCSDFHRPGAGTENANKSMNLPGTCFCSGVADDAKSRCPAPMMVACDVPSEAQCSQGDTMLHQLSIPHFRDVTADLMVKVRGKVFKAHRFLLAHHSGYFYNLLKERQGKLFVEVTLRDISPEAFGALYEWMYTSQLCVCAQNLLEVWYAGQILEIPEAIRLCLDYLHNTKNVPEDLLSLYFQSREVGHKSMTDHILRVMSLVYSRFITTALFSNLDFDGIKFLLTCDNLNINSEKEAFDSVVCWLKGNIEVRRDFIVDIMKCIRFGHMTESELFETLFSESSREIMCYPECRLLVLDGFLSNTSRNLGNMDCFPHLFALPRRCPWDQAEGEKCSPTYSVAKENAQKHLMNTVMHAQQPMNLGNYHQVADPQHVQTAYQPWPKLMPFSKLMPPDVPGEMNKHERKFTCTKWWSQVKENTNALDPTTIKAAPVHALPPSVETQPTYPFRPRSPASSKNSPALTRTYGSKSPSPYPSQSSSPSPTKPMSFQSYCSSPNSSPKCVSRPKTPIPQSPISQGNWSGASHKGWFGAPRALADVQCITASSQMEREEKKREENYAESQVILILGGLNPLESWTNSTAGKLMYTFTPKCVGGRPDGSWNTFSMELPSPRHHAVAVVSSGFVYVAGGCCPSRSRDGRHIEALNTLWRLDLRHKKWDQMHDMLHSRIHHGFVALDKVLIALGGQDETGRLLSSVEMYDIRENKWKEITNMSTPRMGMGAATFRNCVWVCGGMSVKDKEKSPTITKIVECYEASSDRWRAMNPLRFPRCFGTLLECGGFLHLVGGVTRVSARKDGVISSVASIDIHDYVTDEWSFKAALQVPRHSAAAATLDHHLFVIGGITSLEACALDCVECFNDIKGCWDKTTVHLPLPLSGVSCVVVNIQIEVE